MKDFLKSMREEMAAAVQSLKATAAIPQVPAVEGADHASSQDGGGSRGPPSLWEDSLSIPSTQVREQEDPEEGSSYLRDPSSSD